MTAYELARQFCRTYNIQLVTTTEPSYYNPDKFLLNLNVNQTSTKITDLATAAHECGHALQQHNKELWFLVWDVLDKWVGACIIMMVLFIVAAVRFNPAFLVPALVFAAVLFLYRLAVIQNEISASEHALYILRDAGVPDIDLIKASDFLQNCLKEYYLIKKAATS